MSLIAWTPLRRVGEEEVSVLHASPQATMRRGSHAWRATSCAWVCYQHALWSALTTLTCVMT